MRYSNVALSLSCVLTLWACSGPSDDKKPETQSPQSSGSPANPEIKTNIPEPLRAETPNVPPTPDADLEFPPAPSEENEPELAPLPPLAPPPAVHVGPAPFNESDIPLNEPSVRVVCRPSVFNKQFKDFFDKKYRNLHHCCLEWSARDRNGRLQDYNAEMGPMDGFQQDPDYRTYRERDRAGQGGIPGLKELYRYTIFSRLGRCPLTDAGGIKTNGITVVHRGETGATERATCFRRVALSYAEDSNLESSKKSLGELLDLSDKNKGLGGPSYKPSQNCVTFVAYMLNQCGLNTKHIQLMRNYGVADVRPYKAEEILGWETKPKFPGLPIPFNISIGR